MTEQMIRRELSASTGFSDNRLNRRADLRNNPEAVAALAKRPDAQTVLLAGDIPVLLRTGGPDTPPGGTTQEWQVTPPTLQGETLGAWFDLATAAAIAPALEQVFLGEDETGAPRFGTAIDKTYAETLKDDPRFHIIDLRSIAFQKLLPSLLPTHRGQYVAIHDEQVVDSGDDEIALARRVFAKVGNVPIYIDVVAESPRIARVPQSRVVGPVTGVG